MLRVWIFTGVLLGLPVLTLLLAAPVGSARQEVSPAPSVEAALDELGALVSQARFQDVLEKVAWHRSRMLDGTDSPARRLQLARLETLAASAHLALSDAAAADACFARALRHVPDLELDPARSSPKVRRAFEQVRRMEETADPVEASRLFGPGDAPPRAIRGRTLRSPEVAPTLSPTVTLRLLVDTRGDVAEARVYGPRAELVTFERAALEAAQGLRFEPARRDGRPIAVWIQWPVRFE